MSSLPKPIAVVGIGCRFPGGADNPQAFWDLLVSGGDALVDIPRDRWQREKFYDPDATAGTSRVRRGGFLSGPVDRFDPAFFEISPREADHIDPQQRLLLEVAWEALEDSGTPLEHLVCTAAGVFIGGFTLDYSQLQFDGSDRSNISTHTATGVVMTMLANRISHAFDLRGPSVAVDTACSSSLVAVHLACRSLWAGESTVALAGGVNLMLAPNFTIAASQGGFLSPTSRSRPFDADADGYVRGEGAGVVVLKPLADALKQEDRIYAVIRGTAVNQDGRTNGITVPNGESQRRAMHEALATAGVPASSVAYVEAHGTGTPVGDPIEAGAIGAVYGSGADRPPEDRCLLASVKGNIGHLEAAAGVAGLIKAALCLHHRRVPPQAHLATVNPAIDLDRLRLTIPAATEPLPARDGVVRAAVNSFGFGGTNAHVVLESAPVRDRVPADRVDIAPLAPVFPLTARGGEALRELAGRYAEALTGAEHAAIASAAAHRRSHHRQARLAVVADSVEELRDGLGCARDGKPHPAVHTSTGPATGSPLAFVYTGMGPQWWGMGRQLLTNRVFRETIERCDAELRRHAGWSLMDELLADEAGSRMAQTAISQPANFALQVALTELWASLGVRPAAVVGHSAGEIAAAYVAGGLGFADAVRVIYQRARLQHQTAGQGRLVAAAISEERARQLPMVRKGRLAIAAINGPTSVALVGRAADLAKVQAMLEAEDVFCRFVDGDIPFHSPLMDPLETELRRCLAGLVPAAPAIALYSCVTGGRVGEAVHDPDYWWRNVRRPVRFADAATAMVDDGIGAFVELGPHPVLGRSIAECLTARGRHGFTVPSLKRNTPDGATMSHACAELYVAGYAPDWHAFYAADGHRDLPRYPWQRERYWMETAATRADRLGELDHPLLGTRRDTPVPTWRRRLDGSRPAYLADHRVMGATLFPGAGYVEMALAAGRAAFGARRCTVEGVRFEAPTVIRSGPAYLLDTTLDPATGKVEIHGRQPDATQWIRQASARLSPAATGAPVMDLGAIRARCAEQWESQTCYETFRRHGFDYGPRFQSIERLWLGDREALGQLSPRAGVDGDLVLDPIVLDGCFQMLLPLVGVAADEATALMPVGVDRIVLHEPADGALWVHATATGRPGDELTGDAVLATADGRVVLEVRGFRVRVITGRGRARQGTEWRHQVVWEPQGAPPADPADLAPGRWLIFADAAGIGDAVADRLVDIGHSAVLVRPGDRRDLETVVVDLAARGDQPVRGVIDCWSADARAEDLNDERLPAAARRGPLRLVQLVQALDARGLGWPLSLVTVGAQPVDGRIDAAGLLQSPLWGIARVLHQESLPLRSRIMDLDPDRPLAGVPALVDEILRADPDEDQVAWRAGARRVARLQPSRHDGGSVPVTLRPDASYLVTGGLGALGLLSARWLAERGARRIILVGRSPARGAQLDAVSAIERLGAVVETARVDVADPAAMREFVQSRRSAGLPAIGGAIHSAGAVQDQVITRMAPDQLDAVLRPKVSGGWSLHQALAGEPLEFFVVFSSVSSVLVTTGQGNYAAANAFLDGLAHYRRGNGLPALSVNWGPWDVGMIAELELQPLYERRGIDLLSEDTGIGILEELLGSTEAQQVVVSAHWPTLIASYPIVPKLIAHLDDAGDTATDAGGASVAERLAGAAAEERPQIIAGACAEIIGGVLRIAPDRIGHEDTLNHLGLDSMIAVELRIRLEKAFGVAPNVAFLLHDATVTGIAEAIHEQWLAQAAPATSDSPADLAALLGSLDRETADSLLADVEQLAGKGSGT